MSEEFARSTRFSQALPLRLALVLVACVLIAAKATAQDKLVVRATAEGQPLKGALVALIASDNVVSAEGLSSASGTLSFSVTSGDYRIRVRRIGYRPYYSEVIKVPRATPVEVTVESPRVVLQKIVVGASAQCGRINPDAAALAELWEEISKALRASQLTAGDLRGIVRSESYKREVDGDGVVLSNIVTPAAVGSNRPFGAPDPEALVALGYVRGDLVRGWEFFGPDEKVLLSDGFASTHCFRSLRDKTRPGLVGMSFRPAPKRTKGEIEGVIWLDQQSSELREITFNFVNAGELTRFRPSGYSRFTRLPSGTWIVSDWRLRMPKLVEARGESGRVVASGFVETGGRLITTEEAAATRRSYVRGVVFDSLASRPLSGARVTLGSATVDTDQNGNFVINDAASGTTTVSFTHALVAELGVMSIIVPVEISGDTARISLGTPSRRTAWTRICGSAPDSSFENTRGVIHGYVRDGAGKPVERAAVTVLFTEFKAAPTTSTNAYPLRVDVVTGSDGHYAVCSLKRMSVGNVAAQYGGVRSTRSDFNFDKSLIVRRDLVLKQ